MLQTHIQKTENTGTNCVKVQVLDLDENLHAIIVMSAKTESVIEILYNKILDALLDRIHPKNVYKDFSVALENINSLLHTLNPGKGSIKGLHVLVGVFHKDTLYFSSIGKAACLLYNSGKNIIEATEKGDHPAEFQFISSGSIAQGESLIISTFRILDILSKDDITHGFELGDRALVGKNIAYIIEKESYNKAFAVLIVERNDKIYSSQRQQYFQKAQYLFFKSLDNTFVKKTISYVYALRDSLVQQGKKTQQFLFAGGLLLSIFLLYSIISAFFSLASSTGSTQQAREDLLLAQDFVVRASENLNNPDQFSYNIDRAQEKISLIKNKELYTHDLSKIQDDIAILNKKFNGIESFETNIENTLHTFEEPQNIVKILQRNQQIFVVTEMSVIGPFGSQTQPQEYIFEDAASSDIFTHATLLDTDIILTLGSGRIVRFSGNNVFSYADVRDQESWPNSDTIASFGRNIYLLGGQNQNQIFMHRRAGSDFEAGISYLSDEDALSIGKIVGVAIDGGIYLLKLDGTMVKLFRSPDYRLESLILNNLPKNYNFDSRDIDNPVRIWTASNLRYVYMLLDTRILIFQPNTQRFQDVKSLRFIGQIEGKDIDIQDFHVSNDGEIFVASAGGVYKITLSVSDEDDIIIQ